MTRIIVALGVPAFAGSALLLAEAVSGSLVVETGFCPVL